MGQPQLKQDKYTIEEWLALEQETGERYEYHFGEVFCMAGGTLPHARISTNCVRELGNQFEENDKDCESFTSDLKVELKQGNQYVYPDTLAVCGEVEESTTVTGAVKNPILIIEVTSPGTEGYDYKEKFRYYRRIKSVRDYLIVSQERPEVIHYQRQSPKHTFERNDYHDLADSIEIKSIGIYLPLKRIYRKIDFTNPPS